VGPMSVKSFGDMADILAADTPRIWESHRPAEGGKAGAMLAELIEEAARRKAGKGVKKDKGKPTPTPTPTRKPTRRKVAARGSVKKR
jgi:hypothetical protein